MLLNNERIVTEIQKEIKSYQETNENEHTRTQNLRDTESSPERKFEVLQVYIKKQE